MPEYAPEDPEKLQVEEETNRFFGLMGSLAKKYGTLEAAAQALDRDSDIAAAVILKWFRQRIIPNPQIRKRLLNSLQYLVETDLQRLGLGPKKLIPPMASKPKLEKLPGAEPGKETGKE